MSLFERLQSQFSRKDDAPAPAGLPAGEGIQGVDLNVDDLLRIRHLAERMDLPKAAPRSTLPGNVAHRRRGRGLEVHDIRSWSDGDDVRHLDRNVMARTGIPHVRTFREERERAVLLVADFRPSMLFGTRRALRSVAAAEALTLLGWRAARDGRVGLMVIQHDGGHLIRYGRGARAMIAMVSELERAHRNALASRSRLDPPLTESLEEADRLAGKNAAIVVATALDEPGPQFDEIVARIALRRDLCFALIADRFETAPPQGSYPYATMAGAAGWLRIGADAAPKPDERVARLQRLGARALSLDSSLDVEAMAPLLERLDG
ncbi:DUF58 domain-containing protein [Methylocella silvestris]|uniref:DUF58 domain-containing protein n=1 Tax=Methylocella silvestris TaxID=199596 RepID=A0A2J7THD8_METSI|nr:DUF58 domain-containing protein [Methylocella silvestris]PNG26184.1 DUF58 domain-containing protein [Methylocella silvestris]